VTEYPHVVVEHGVPRIEGTRVRVARLWLLHKKGCPIATIMSSYPHIPKSAILSALAFAYDNDTLIVGDLLSEAHERLDKLESW
jgi:uncharacterized protein (DUF433 family)